MPFNELIFLGLCVSKQLGEKSGVLKNMTIDWEIWKFLKMTSKWL